MAECGDDSGIDDQLAGLLDGHHRIARVIVGHQLDVVTSHSASGVGLAQRQPDGVDHVIADIAVSSFKRSDQADLQRGAYCAGEGTSSEQEQANRCLQADCRTHQGISPPHIR